MPSLFSASAEVSATDLVATDSVSSLFSASAEVLSTDSVVIDSVAASSFF